MHRPNRTKLKKVKYILIVSIVLFFLTFHASFSSNNSDEDGDDPIEIKSWRNITSMNEEQILVPVDVLIKVEEFMQRNIKEDDQEMVELVRSLIKPPKLDGVKLHSKHQSDFSQIGQSKFIDGVLNKKTNGFFVESGGFDGESFSNSLFFELKRNWTGILIESIPSLHKMIESKNRNVYTINACIAGKTPFVAKFRVLHVLSGRMDDMGENHKKRIEKESNNQKLYVFVPCFPLSTILRAININRINYFSLDIEGGEWTVIKDLDFKSTFVDTLTIEWASYPETRQLIINRLKENNFELIKSDASDLYFKNKNLVNQK